MSDRFKLLNNIHVQQFIDFLKFEHKNRKNIQDEVSEELQDLLESRITESNTYTGKEIIESLDDIPDLVEGTMDRQLEHVRDITMVMIKSVFTQAKENNVEINLNVSKLEDEQMLNASHAFCESLIKDPEAVLAAAPKVQGKVASSKQSAAVSSNDPRDELAKLQRENQQLKSQIQFELEKFPQYAKLKQMIHEREVEIRGVKARL